MVRGLIGGEHRYMVASVLVVTGLALMAKSYFRKHNNITLITNERIISVTGTMFSKKKYFYLHRVGTVKVKQSPFEKMLLHYGKVIIKDKDLTHGSEELDKEHMMELEEVAQPKKFKKEIFKAIKAHNMRSTIVEKRNQKKRLGVVVKTE